MKGSSFKLNKVATKSALKQASLEEGRIGKSLGKKAIIEGVKSVAPKIGKGLGALSIPATLYGMYQSGQEKSGGAVGYEQNPNWDGVVQKGDLRFGDRNSTSQFIPTEKTVKREEFEENIRLSNKKKLEEKKKERKKKDYEETQLGDQYVELIDARGNKTWAPYDPDNPAHQGQKTYTNPG